MDKFTDENLEIIRRRLKEALADVSVQYGIKFDLKGIQYSDVSFTAEVQGVLTAAENKIKQDRMNRLDEVCEPYGMKGIYNKTFELSNKTFRVVDTSQNTVDNVVVENVDDLSLFEIKLTTAIQLIKHNGENNGTESIKVRGASNTI